MIKDSQNTDSLNSQEKKPGLVNTIGNFLPFASLVYEQFTGQKVPQITGTIAEMQLTLSQMQNSLKFLVDNQQGLIQRITNLEISATQQFTALTQHFQSLRLTHTKERKEIEYQPRTEDV